MSESLSCADDSLSLAALLRIEQVCFRFETAWRQGQQPHIEDFLNGGRGERTGRTSGRSAAIGPALSPARDREPVLAEYEARLPDHVSLVRALFDETSEMPSTVARVDFGNGDALTARGRTPAPGILPTPAQRWPIPTAHSPIRAQFGTGDLGAGLEDVRSRRCPVTKFSANWAAAEWASSSRPVTGTLKRLTAVKMILLGGVWRPRPSGHASVPRRLRLPA